MAQRILRPLGYGELLDELFDLYKKNFTLFAGIAGVVYVPMAVLTTLAVSPIFLMMGDLTNGTPPPGDPTMFLARMIPAYLALFVLSIVGGIMQVVAMGATTWAVSSCYLGMKPTILQSYKAVLPKMVPFILTFVLMYIGLVLGFVLCILPGIFVSVVLAFVPQVMILENKEYFDAISRSYRLAIPHWGRILVMGIICTLVVYIASLVVSGPFQFAAVFFKSGMPWLYMVSSLLQGLSGTLTIPIWVIVFVLLYYDVRVRMEGFDVEMLAAGIGAPSPGPVTPSEN